MRQVWTGLAVLAALGASSPAYALDYWMWGAGPRVGTNVLPGRFPVRYGWPTSIDTDNDGAPDADPEEPFNQVFTGAGPDFLFGGTGVYYVNAHSRLGINANIDLAPRFYATDFVFKYDWIQPSDAIDFVVGAGTGAGAMGWRAVNGRDERLRVNYFPLRGEVGGIVRNGTQAYQLTAFAQYNVPSRTTFVDADGVRMRAGWGIYFTSGIEVSVMFGDFTPPRPKRGPR